VGDPRDGGLAGTGPTQVLMDPCEADLSQVAHRRDAHMLAERLLQGALADVGDLGDAPRGEAVFGMSLDGLDGAVDRGGQAHRVWVLSGTGCGLSVNGGSSVGLAWGSERGRHV
jgi:hypothetical protein